MLRRASDLLIRFYVKSLRWPLMWSPLLRTGLALQICIDEVQQVGMAIAHGCADLHKWDTYLLSAPPRVQRGRGGAKECSGLAGRQQIVMGAAVYCFLCVGMYHSIFSVLFVVHRRVPFSLLALLSAGPWSPLLCISQATDGKV